MKSCIKSCRLQWILACALLISATIACELPGLPPDQDEESATESPEVQAPSSPVQGTPIPTNAPQGTEEPTPTFAPTAPIPAETVASPTPVDPVQATPDSEGSIVAQSEGSGPFAIAALTGVTLEAGREYVLEVASKAGTVEFYGSHMSGAEVELLDAVTPATYEIVDPGGQLLTWKYSVSVQNRGSGGIILVVRDVTESSS
jgi:hypothetical protein